MGEDSGEPSDRPRDTHDPEADPRCPLTEDRRVRRGIPGWRQSNVVIL
jgi:hypothetical protein